jgi:hypothetical protein
MQLTKNEIAETQIIVTTPEKWDVVTRQPSGEGKIASVCLFSHCLKPFVLEDGYRHLNYLLLMKSTC